MNYKTEHRINHSVDSMTVICPVILFSLDAEFYDSITTVVDSTGEILNSTNKPVVSEIYGIKIRAFIVNLFGTEYLSITFSSKLLKSNYLQGLSLDNFENAFNLCKELLKFEINFSVFLTNSKCYDIDVKYDFFVNDDVFSSFLQGHKNFANCRLFRSNGDNYIRTSYYSGMQFVNRKDASIGKPFVKYYSKFYEAQDRSEEFFRTFNISISRYLRRFEATIKNSKHLERYGLDNKLTTILALNSLKINAILDDMYLCHVGTSADKILIEKEVKDLKITLSDWVLFSSLSSAMVLEKSSLSVLLSDYFDSFPNINPQSKSRKIRILKKKFDVFLQVQRKYDLNNFRMTANDAFYQG